jgi:uncharacterized membrane protein YeiH
MQYYVEHTATVVAAIAGALAAKGKQVDLFGVIVLALASALGGGTVRDVILDARPVFWVADSSFVITSTVGALVAFVFARYGHLSEKPLLYADAFGLALFTVVGVEKSLRLGVSPTIAVVMGVVTGVAGGMLRDVLTGEIPFVFRRQIYLYATACLCGALVFVLLRSSVPESSLRFIAMGTTLMLRLAAIWWKIHLPEFETPAAAGEKPSGP